ncbi:hypothetical protein [Serinibacter arcticus]|nr:hypothetical protein [Serinibacter arcticus]
MTSAPSIPGCAGLELGLPWRGTATARSRSGELVRVQRLDLTPSDRSLVRRRAQRLVELEADGLAAVRSLHDGVDGALVVVTDLVAGPRLSDVATADGGLSADGVQRLLLDLAAALAALHAHGLGHGAITAEAVVLRPEGAVLTDLLAEALHGRGRGATAERAVRQLAPERRGGHAVAATRASDVWELAAVVAQVLASGTRTGVHDLDPDVGELLEAASADDPAARPSAARIAAVAGARGAREPGRAWGRVAPDTWEIGDAVAEAEREVVLLAPTLVGRRRGAGRARRWAGAAGAAVALALGAWTLVLPHGSSIPPGSADLAAGAPLGPAAAFALRDRALETGDAAMLARAVQPGGPAWRRDLTTIDALRRGGVVLDGVRTVVLPAEASAGPGAVLVAQAAHRRHAGGVTSVSGPQPPSCLVVAAIPTPSGTRLVDWAPCA